jgi:hypothetical protein
MDAAGRGSMLMPKTSSKEPMGHCSLHLMPFMKVKTCFFLPHPPARAVFSVATAGAPDEVLSLPLDQDTPNDHANVVSISVASHDGNALELQGRVDGSLHLLHYHDRRVLLSYDVSKTDPITKVSLRIADSRLQIVVLLQSGKLMAVEGLCFDDVVQSPPVQMVKLLPKLRFRVGAVGSSHDQKPSLVHPSSR